MVYTKNLNTINTIILHKNLQWFNKRHNSGMVTLIYRNYTRHHDAIIMILMTWEIENFWAVLYLWPGLPKRVLYTHSFKTHFSLPFVNASTAHVFKNAEGWTVCFNSCDQAYSQAFLMSMSVRVALNGPTCIFPWQADSRLWITTRLVHKFGHEFSCFVWHVKVKMAPMEVISLF